MSLNYSLGEEIDDMVLDLVQRIGPTSSPNLIREIATTAFKLVEDGATRGELKIMNSAMKELRHAFRLFAPYRSHRKVSIFGSARTAPENAEYGIAEALAGLLARSGFMVITGAGPGIMEAANRGAGEESSFGLAIRLPIEPEPNSYIRRADRLINFKYFFTRKLVFIKESDAVVLFPGGFGTMDELFELLTLLQTGKCDPRPVILVDPPGVGYWESWLVFTRGRLAERGYIDPDDLALLSSTSDPETAVREIDHFYSRYHSSRFVGERLLLRLRRPPEERELKQWSAEFRDMVAEDGIALCELPNEDREDPLLRGLHGISMLFDRKSFARLRKLIDAVNGPLDPVPRKGHTGVDR